MLAFLDGQKPLTLELFVRFVSVSLSLRQRFAYFTYLVRVHSFVHPLIVDPPVSTVVENDFMPMLNSAHRPDDGVFPQLGNLTAEGRYHTLINLGVHVDQQEDSFIGIQVSTLLHPLREFLLRDHRPRALLEKSLSVTEQTDPVKAFFLSNQLNDLSFTN